MTVSKKIKTFDTKIEQIKAHHLRPYHQGILVNQKIYKRYSKDLSIYYYVVS